MFLLISKNFSCWLFRNCPKNRILYEFFKMVKIDFWTNFSKVTQKSIFEWNFQECLKKHFYATSEYRNWIFEKKSCSATDYAIMGNFSQSIFENANLHTKWCWCLSFANELKCCKSMPITEFNKKGRMFNDGAVEFICAVNEFVCRS